MSLSLAKFVNNIENYKTYKTVSTKRLHCTIKFLHLGTAGIEKDTKSPPISPLKNKIIRARKYFFHCEPALISSMNWKPVNRKYIFTIGTQIYCSFYQFNNIFKVPKIYDAILEDCQYILSLFCHNEDNTSRIEYGSH